MATLTEDFVSFETAKLLKEKKFDVPITSVWIDHFKLVGCPASISIYPNEKNWNGTTGSLKDIYTSAPTLQTTMKWLREVHKIDIVVMPTAVDDTFKPNIIIYPVCNGQYEWMCMRGDGTAAIFGYNINKCFCNSHEAACEVSIKYCLENLI